MRGLLVISLFSLLIEAATVSRNARCGSSFATTCQGSTYGPCCSQYGWCGASPDYCGTGCQNAFGTCNSGPASPSKPSPIRILSSSTRVSSTPLRSPTPSASQPTSHNARCGASFSGQTCLGTQYGDCCSKSFYCGSSSAYCSPQSCQAGYGRCDAVSSYSRSSTRSSISQGPSSTLSSSRTSAAAPLSTPSPALPSASSVQSSPSSSTPTPSTPSTPPVVVTPSPSPSTPTLPLPTACNRTPGGIQPNFLLKLTNSGTIYDGRYGAEENEVVVFKDITDASVFTFNAECDIVAVATRHLGDVYTGSNDSPVYLDPSESVDGSGLSRLLCDIQNGALSCSAGPAVVFYICNSDNYLNLASRPPNSLTCGVPTLVPTYV